MLQKKNVSFLLLGILIISIYGGFIKIIPMSIDQIIEVNSINTALLSYGLPYMILLIIAVLLTFHFLKKEKISMTTLVVFLLALGVTVLIEYWVGRSENLMIANFEIEREERMKILGAMSYLGFVFKILFFIIISLKFFKTE